MPSPDPTTAESLETDLEQLLAAWRRIDAGMKDLPVYHPALSLEAVDVRSFEGGHLGIVISPWFMNLVLLPAPGDPLLPLGQKRVRVLPSGPLEFTGSCIEGAPPFEYRSLHSPMEAFASQEQARDTAVQAMAALFAPPPAASSVPEPERAEGGVDRRAFFRRFVQKPPAPRG